MTDDSGCRVRELLPGSIEGMEDAVRNELEKESARGGPGVVWSFVATQATESMAEALDIDAFEVIAQGWRLARELHEYTDAQKHKRGEHTIVSLGEHNFTTSVHPVLNVTVDGFAAQALQRTEQHYKKSGCGQRIERKHAKCDAAPALQAMTRGGVGRCFVLAGRLPVCSVGFLGAHARHQAHFEIGRSVRLGE